MLMAFGVLYLRVVLINLYKVMWKDSIYERFGFHLRTL